MDYGGKANNLILLRDFGFNVPEFVVLSNKEIRKSIQDDSLEKLINTKTKGIKANTFSVRSSANAEDSKDKSFSGIFKTSIDIKRKDLKKEVMDVWESAYDAKEYSQKKIAMNVIIQKYISAKYFGVCFTNLKSKIIINVHKGIGEDLVSGLKQSSEIIIDRETLIFLKNNFVNSEVNLNFLIKNFFQIEKSFSYPLDIEFCIDKANKPWILQARSITTN